MKVPTPEEAARAAQKSRSAKASRLAGRPIDVQLGQTITALRCARGLSQTALGKTIGVSYQQVQKYEKGSSALGISRLHAIAMALDVDVTTFIRDLPSAPPRTVDPRDEARAAFAASREGVRFLDAFRALPAHPRRMTLAAIAALAECVRTGGKDKKTSRAKPGAG